MNPNHPSRREVLTAAPLAAAAIVFPAGIAWPAHRAGFCGCQACATRRAEDNRPPRIAAAVACWKARTAVEVLDATHVASCKDPDCDVCPESDFAFYHLALYADLLEERVCLAPEVEQARAEHQRALKGARAGGLLRLPRKGANHPAHEPAVRALQNLDAALGALLDSCPCKSYCATCIDALGVRGGVSRAFSGLQGCLLPVRS